MGGSSRHTACSSDVRSLYCASTQPLTVLTVQVAVIQVSCPFAFQQSLRPEIHPRCSSRSWVAGLPWAFADAAL